MQIDEALNRLKKELGIACGARQTDKPDNSREDEMGRSISGSNVSFVPSAERSIRTFDSNQPPEVMFGGKVIISFDGAQQPEAARTLDSIITPILNRMQISDKQSHRYRKGETIERVMDFTVPADKAGDFTAQLIEVANLLKRNPQLRQQFRAATDLSIEQLNKIPGAKPYVQLELGSLQFEDANADFKPPHFNLVIEGTPVPLAKRLAEVSGQDLAGLKDTKLTTSRDHTKIYYGGKQFKIAMDDPKSPGVIEAVKQYVALMGQFVNGDGNDNIPGRPA